MFRQFNLKTKKRTRADEPHNHRTWVSHGLSEFFGTAILSLLLAGLSIKTSSSTLMEHYLLHPVIIGFYAGFIAVGLVLIIFLRWSCDLNPIVTIARMLNGTNTYRYGIYKIIIQMVSGLITGLVVYGIGVSFNNEVNNQVVANHAIDAFKVSGKSFGFNLNWEQSNATGGTWIFFVEMIMGALLLFPIFSKNINDKYRDLLIMLVISMVVWMGLLSGTAAINPARGLAQQVPGLFFKAGASTNFNSLIIATMTMIFGNLMAPFFYLFMQGIAEKYINPFVVKAIKFRNFRSDNMRLDNQDNKKI